MQLYTHFDRLQQWIDQCSDLDVCESSMETMRQIIYDGDSRDKLEVELAVVVDVGSDFVKAIYDLEGDGILALECYSIMNTFWQRIDIIRSAANQNDGTILSVCSKLDKVFARNKFASNYNYKQKRT